MQCNSLNKTGGYWPVVLCSFVDMVYLASLIIVHCLEVSEAKMFGSYLTWPLCTLWLCVFCFFSFSACNFGQQSIQLWTVVQLEYLMLLGSHYCHYYGYQARPALPAMNQACMSWLPSKMKSFHLQGLVVQGFVLLVNQQCGNNFC